MKDYKIASIMMQVELIKTNKDGEVIEKHMVPVGPNGQVGALGFVGAEIPKQLKDMIFARLKTQGEQK